MDEQRNPPADAEQEIEAAETTPAPPKTMFDRAEEDRAAMDEMTRFARKRAALWGLAAGGLMSLILIVCALLLYLLGTR